MPKTMPCVAILAAGLGAIVWKAPYMQLASQLSSGQLDGRRILVTDFVPERPAEGGVPVRLGTLGFSVPATAAIEPMAPDGSFGLWVKLPGMRCAVLPPRHAGPDGDSAPWDSHGTAGPDELSRQASICAASGRDLSFWMSAGDVELLRDRLEIRPAFCLAAERVEVVRAGALYGLLLSWQVEGSPRLVFRYFSADTRTHDTVFLYPESDSVGAMRAARALVSTFTLEQGERSSEASTAAAN